jgi:hypothetical protein
MTPTQLPLWTFAIPEQRDADGINTAKLLREKRVADSRQQLRDMQGPGCCERSLLDDGRIVELYDFAIGQRHKGIWQIEIRDINTDDIIRIFRLRTFDWAARRARSCEPIAADMDAYVTMKAVYQTAWTTQRFLIVPPDYDG